MSFLLGGHKRITHPTQGGLLLKKFENHYMTGLNKDPFLQIIN